MVGAFNIIYFGDSKRQRLHAQRRRYLIGDVQLPDTGTTDSCVSPPLCELRGLVDGILTALNADFEWLHDKMVRPSIPLECLLRVNLIQTLYSILPER